MKKNIDFISIRYLMISISLIFMLCELGITIYNGGFNLGIDFKPGISLEFNLGKQSNTDELKSFLDTEYKNVSIQSLGAQNDVFNIIVSDNGKIENFQDTVSKKIIEIVKSKFPQAILNGEFYISPSLSNSSTIQITGISFAVLILILIYIAFRFEWTYAVGAIVALFHDGIISLLFVGMTKLELSLPIIVSIITIIGYSLNDTIVIFDRVRENVKLEVDHKLSKVINLSINSTLIRSLLTSFTTMITMVALVFFSKGDVRNFAIIMIVGILVGTYSSVFIASPVLLFLKKDKITPKPIKKPEDNIGQDLGIVKDTQTINFEKERKRIEEEIARKNKK